MKNRLPASGASGKPSRPPKPSKGRWARVYLSPEFQAWAKRNALKPAGVAPAVLHTFALRLPGTQDINIASSHPDADKYLFDKKEGR